MTETAITIKAPGKLILLGEYAVLEQGSALVAAIDKQCKVSIEPGRDDFLFIAPNLNLPPVSFSLDNSGEVSLNKSYSADVCKKLGFVFSIMKYVTRQSGRKIPGAVIHVDTGDFYHPTAGKKLGLGSSAALTVGLISALNELIGEKSWMKSLYYEALQAHRIAQGKLGSGVDVAATTHGGTIRYKMPKQLAYSEQAFNQCAWPDDLYMVPVWTGISASTRTLIKKVNEFRTASFKAYRYIMDGMVELSEQGAHYFEQGSTQNFLDVVEAFANQERRLGRQSDAPIMSSVHEQLAAIISRTGGVYKPSGAGGGDIGIALCRSEETRKHIIQEIKKSAFEFLNLSPQLEGVKCTQTHEFN